MWPSLYPKGLHLRALKTNDMKALRAELSRNEFRVIPSSSVPVRDPPLLMPHKKAGPVIGPAFQRFQNQG
jgi:hypothetical protein